MVDMNDLHAHDISLELRNTLQQLLINRDSFSCLNNTTSHSSYLAEEANGTCTNGNLKGRECKHLFAASRSNLWT